ncbi:MAG TPA: GH3 auxin-responsive promoter family protein [Gemmataceae bacterium]|nr:GH3 auxin-responsive promoter family protein [Gemmataceae bacterium]
MLGRFLVKLLRKAVARPLYRKFAVFEAHCQQPQAAQEELLRGILAYHADTAFGRDHGFSHVRTVADFRRQVPVAPYEQFEPYIRRVMRGETQALLADPQVLMFALTSGTTASRKHIPITQQYLDDYRRGWNLWGLRAIKKHKQVFLKPILQLAGDADEYRTETGISCGNLSGFTAQVQRRLMRWMYVVPPATGKVKDAHARTYVAVRCGLQKKLGMLMSANPSTLVNLARFMDREKQPLIRDIADGTLNSKLDIPVDIRAALELKLKPRKERAAELDQFANQAGALLPRDAWPADRLLIGCWTGGSVGLYLRQLSKYYGDAPVRDVGLLASEGRMSIPVEDGTPSGVLDISTHYFEFIPEGEIDYPSPTVLGAHEVQEGKHYYIVPTTKAGLYRYHISDVVRITGFFHKTPTIEFLGKGHRFANLTGEKLSEHHITQAVDRIVQTVAQPLAAYALAPCWDDVQPYYGLFLEEPDARDAALLRRFLLALDLALGENNIEYEAKRTSGRLGAVRAHILPAGFWSQWDRERVAATGGAPEQYKHPCLIGDVRFRQSVPVIEGKAAA